MSTCNRLDLESLGYLEHELLSMLKNVPGNGEDATHLLAGLHSQGYFVTRIGENRHLVTDEPVEFEKLPVGVQDRREITDHCTRIYRIYPI